MAHNLYRLSETVWNKPHLITPEAFQVVLSYLSHRNSSSFLMPPMEPDSDLAEEDGEDEKDDNTVAGIGVLNISGSLTYKPVMTMCGEVGTSYQSLAGQVEEMIEGGCTTIVMNVSSGGGEAGHCFETAQDIRDMCTASGVTLVAYADTLACSAAYALSVVADELIVNPSASVGSIGCVVALLDTSKAMEMAGLKQIFISSGDSKVPFADDGSFKQEFLDEIQEDVDELNSQFAAHVSAHTGLDSDAIKALQAKVYGAQEAVDMGLATSVMTNKQFAAYVADLHEKGGYAKAITEDF